ncbi:MAG TPA: hypothetical protein VGF15_03440 [Solirubrobacteraceae bacterium]|jgi:hypothetical protein
MITGTNEMTVLTAILVAVLLFNMLVVVFGYLRSRARERSRR